MESIVQHTAKFLPMIDRADVFPSSWVTLGLVLAFALYCFLLPNSIKLFSYFFANYWNTDSRVNFDSTQNNHLFKFILLLGTFVCYGFFAVRLFGHQFIYNPQEWILILGFSLFFLVAFWLKIALIHFLGFVFNKSALAALYTKDVISLVSLNFLIVFPLVVISLFVVNFTSFLWMNISVAVALISAILLFIKQFRLFFQGIPSLFYLFLYLCTSEILPVLLVIKVISNEFLIVKF